ncbi:MAG: hypothetical protein RLZ98_692 [Pseudomonadota bacterium]|jgi:flavin reductase (DIM6/NTAB) family NADH-FMN oxidoreductase RutF
MAGNAAESESVEMKFRGAMRRLAATVNIISVKVGDDRHGTTATAVTSLSMDPPSVLVCINRTSRAHPLLKKAAKFGVNILHTDNCAVSAAFSSQMTAEEKFGVGDWQIGANDVPYLADAQAWLICSKEQEVDYGTHTIFIGRIVEAEVREDVSPLLYSDGKYAACGTLDE